MKMVNLEEVILKNKGFDEISEECLYVIEGGCMGGFGGLNNPNPIEWLLNW